jgi:oligopeptidase A
MSNPLLNLSFEIPFDQIQAEHVEPAMDQLLAEAKARLEAIAAAPQPPDYANTLHAIDELTEPLDIAYSAVRHLESVATTPELRAAHNAVQPKVSEFYSMLPLHEGLWQRVKGYAASGEAPALEGTRKRFLKKTIDGFKRHGADLDAAGKEKLRAIDVELAMITTKFGQNVLDATNAFEMIITDESKLAGLPESARAAARASAQQKGREGWRFTLQAPSYLAVMTYMDNRAIREAMYRAYNQRAAFGDFDNRENILKILELRKQKAQLLGFKDFADFVLDDRMAKNGSRAQGFLEDLNEKTKKRFDEENRELRDFAGIDLQPWDIAYYAEKLRAKLYEFDEEELRPYFPADRVMQGMFEIFGRILGIRVAPVSDEQGVGLPGWDPDVRSYAIYDAASNQHLGSFYTDWFPRENKRGGAWMDSLVTGNPKSGKPHLGLICGNLTPPVDDKPALLTHREVETIFHEFGHLLHHSLSQVEVRSLSGTNVAWDFVELPSQIMENWCWERESLDLFARHYETGAMIPDDLFQKMKRARTFRAANAQMRQLSFGFVDLALHRDYSGDGDVVAYTRAILDRFSAAPLPPEHSMVTGFTHLFSSPVAYGAGYYSYKWAEVLDADAFSRFRREGVFNNAVGLEYRKRILEKGDSEEPGELFRSFMGRDPDPRALLERAGLV